MQSGKAGVAFRIVRRKVIAYGVPLAALLAGIVVGYLLTPSPTGSATYSAQPQEHAKRLYLEAISRADSSARRSAAAQLARAPGSDPWLVLLIASETPDVAVLPDEIRAGLKSIEAGVIAAAIEGLDSHASDAVLMALVAKLDDMTEGRWSTQTAFTKADSLGDPIRDNARSALVRILGVDMSYDKQAWFKAIVDREREAGQRSD